MSDFQKIPPNNMLKYAKRSFIFFVCAGLAWLIAYSIEQYKLQDGENIFICDDEECFQTTHVHADISFDLCGEVPVLPRETGPLDGLHTHKEKDYLHFHDRVEIDKPLFEQSGEKVWLYEESLSVQEVIDVFELDPEKFCGTDEVTIEVLVNGETPKEGLEYNWSDDDEIELIYRKK